VRNVNHCLSKQMQASQAIMAPPLSLVLLWSAFLATQVRFRERVFFGEYELDFRAGELRRNGNLLKLQPQPATILAILVARAGEVVTRQELAEQVWGSETYVDFEHGLNFAVRQIRSVLQDDAEQPRFLETVPKRGYRFIAPINDVVPVQIETPERSDAHSGLIARFTLRHAIIFLTSTAAVTALVAFGWLLLLDRLSGPRSAQGIEALGSAAITESLWRSESGTTLPTA